MPAPVLLGEHLGMLPRAETLHGAGCGSSCLPGPAAHFPILLCMELGRANGEHVGCNERGPRRKTVGPGGVGWEPSGVLRAKRGHAAGGEPARGSE